MSQPHTPDDDMPAEIDFSGGTRSKFYRPGATLNLPVYLESVNEMLRKDIELIEMAK